MRQFIGVDRAADHGARRSCSPTASPTVARTAARLERGRGAAGRRPRRTRAARVRGGARRVGARRRLPRRGAVGPLRAAAFGGGVPESRRPAGRARCRAASVSGSRWRSCCARRSTCSCSTSPTTPSTSPGKEWLEARIARGPKTILFVSHDRTAWTRTATQVVTLEGRATWTHPARVRHVRRGPRRQGRAARRAAPPLRRGAPAPDRDGQGDEAQGRVQRRLGVEGALGGTRLERFVEREQPP